MKRTLGLAGVFAVVLVLELATGAWAQDKNPFGESIGGPGSS